MLALLKLPAMQTELKNKARIAEVSPSARPANPRLTHRGSLNPQVAPQALHLPINSPIVL